VRTTKRQARQPRGRYGTLVGICPFSLTGNFDGYGSFSCTDDDEAIDKAQRSRNFADPTAKRCVTTSITSLLCISDPSGFSIWHRGPRVDRGAQSSGTTTLWRVALQRRRGKSPLAIESIDDRYCRSPRGDAKPLKIWSGFLICTRHAHSERTARAG
jgi:hypothetical protein